MNTNEIALLEVPLGIEAHRLARQFAAEQYTPQKRKQVYLNTLAVYAVHRYLQWLQVDTDLSCSDSWHPVLRNRWDVADLFIPGIGKLECRPVLPGETAFALPLEVTEDRIGYIGVQFSEQLDYVQLLGFAKAMATAISPQQLFISELQPLEKLPDYLAWREEEFPNPPHESELVDVGDWIRNKSSWNLANVWIPLSVPPSGSSTKAVFRRFSTEEFETIVTNARQFNQIEIPSEAVAACRDIEVDQSRIRLYVTSWLEPDAEVREWTLLLILSTTPEVYPTQEIKLQVSDQTKIFVEEELKLSSNQPPKIVQLVGELHEKFRLTVTSLNGEERKSYWFECSLGQQP